MRVFLWEKGVLLTYNNNPNDPDSFVDTVNLFVYLNSLTKVLNINDVRIDDRKLFGIIAGMKRDFPHADGIDAASPFKKMAIFVSYFVSERPIFIPFPKEIIGDDLSKIHNHQNAIVALLFAIDNLHHAVINKTDGTVCKLEHKITVSKHSFIDLVDAISTATPSTHFKMLSVLFEQMAYKTNPECQYNNML